MNFPRDSLYNAEQAHTLDRLAIAAGTPSASLMARAGEAAWRCLRWQWPRARRIAVLCGAGNNGGDAYVLAQAAQRAGRDVRLIAPTPPATVDARAAAQTAQQAGARVQDYRRDVFTDCDVVVDGLFGVGLARDVVGIQAEIIAAANASGVPIFALDIPSGLDADTGRVRGIATKADLTLSFIGLKAGLFTGHGPEYAGRVRCDDLAVPASVYAQVTPHAERILPERLVLPRRARHAHKGEVGHVWVAGGIRGMSGAALLCSAAAYRVGAGLVTLATDPAHVDAIAGRYPEIVVVEGDRESPFARADVIALGPGLGRTRWSEEIYKAALANARTCVVDADALNLLAQTPMRRDDWILTPHPGEAARLLQCTSVDVQADRFSAARELARRFGGVCVLKGAGTIISDGARVALCDRGNPGMATGGTGDVLTGAIAGLYAQGLSPWQAATLGVWLHAAAGDTVAREGAQGLLAGDLLAQLRAALHSLTVARL